GLFTYTDRGTQIGVIVASAVDAADDAFVQSLHRLLRLFTTASLRAHLDGPLVLPGSLDHQLPFLRVVRAGLFDVDVLACTTGQNRRGGMPVVRGSTD